MSDGDAQFAALQDAVAGTWSLEREIGRGGMATVYLARDVALDRPVAIKLLHATLASDAAQRERFLREARTGARLSHPHVVPIYDVVERDDLVFFVMGFVDGESLGDRIRREGPLAAGDAERILREIGWALAAAHAAGVLHRDVTVENILLERRTGRALLADFGIAAERDAGEAGALIGTPAYLAPELVHGESASVQSDLYALGIVGWTMLTGRLPFADDDPATVLLRQVREEIPSLDRAAAATPSRLMRAVEALIHKEPAARPATAEAWLDGLATTDAGARLALPLERWVSLRDQLRPFQALAVTTVGMIGAAAAMITVYAVEVSLVTLGALVLGVIGGTAVIHVGMSARSVRQAARAGFRLQDLQLALDRRIAERIARGPIVPTGLGRMLRVARGFAAVALISSLILAVIGRLPDGVPWAIRLWLWRNLADLLPLTWVAFWALRGVAILVPGRARPAIDRRWRWRLAFWRSAWARRYFALMSTGLGARQPESTLHRPTELVLGLEIGDLWRALPASTRFGLGDLPDTAEALRRRVAELRTALAHLGDDQADELRELRERLVTRRDLAVTMLERLRLLLLRLTRETDLPGELTRHLRDARALEVELLHELGADRRVRKLIRSGPAASPA